MREEIFERVRAIRDEGVAVVMVEQNAKEALSFSDRGYVLVAGRNVLHQSGADLLTNADVGRLFMGQEETSSDAATAAPA